MAVRGVAPLSHGAEPHSPQDANPRSRRRIGVLALQGDVAEHRHVLDRLGARSVEVRTRQDLEEVEGLVIPGGESTTMLKLLERFELADLLIRRVHCGLPVFGTCAGAIVLATEVSDGEPPLGLLGLRVRRNAYGRQRESFEAELDVKGVGMIRAVFIRAPVFESLSPGVEVLAEWAECPVLVRSGGLLASSFHPELTGDSRLHRYFLEQVVGGEV
ncbi:MAG: pyridoxal 5'-phosphate synthase glutaminase subunit PdxT [Actinomycetota bacterium]